MCTFYIMSCLVFILKVFAPLNKMMPAELEEWDLSDGLIKKIC